jgi:hypothetical protein
VKKRQIFRKTPFFSGNKNILKDVFHLETAPGASDIAVVFITEAAGKKLFTIP